MRNLSNKPRCTFKLKLFVRYIEKYMLIVDGRKRARSDWIRGYLRGLDRTQ